MTDNTLRAWARDAPIAPLSEYAQLEVRAAILELFDRLHTLEQERDAAKARTPPDDWFNQICAALGLFDGARPVSTQSVTWKEVLPMIAALKANNPEAAVMVAELQRVRELWADALHRLCAKSPPLGPPVPACPQCQSLKVRWSDQNSIVCENCEDVVCGPIPMFRQVTGQP